MSSLCGTLGHAAATLSIELTKTAVHAPKFFLWSYEHVCEVHDFSWHLVCLLTIIRNVWWQSIVRNSLVAIGVLREARADKYDGTVEGFLADAANVLRRQDEAAGTSWQLNRIRIDNSGVTVSVIRSRAYEKEKKNIGTSLWAHNIHTMIYEKPTNACTDSFTSTCSGSVRTVNHWGGKTKPSRDFWCDRTCDHDLERSLKKSIDKTKCADAVQKMETQWRWCACTWK